MSALGLFAYGSLVSRASIAATLGRDLPAPLPARLAGWRRRWSLVRDNARSEKSFEPLGGPPFAWCLGLNLEPAPEAAAALWPNGVVIELEEPALARLDLREIRYRRLEVTEAVRAPGAARFARVFAFVAKPEHHAATPPPGSVVIAAYLRAVEAAFAELGELATFRATTQPPPVDVVEARLVRDEIRAGNPREW